MRLSVAMAVACLVTTGLSAADQAKAAIRKPTNIEAQALAPALQLFAKERDVQIVYRSELVGALKTGGAAGELTMDEALAQLLNGTGLTYQPLADEGITIVPVAGGGSISAVSRPVRSFWDRFRVVQASSSQSQGGGAQRANEDGKATGDSSSQEDESVKVEEIVVTAQRREERLQDVPISMSILSGTDLDRSSSRSVADVLNQVGGVSVSGSRPGQTTITIRGVQPESFTSSTTGYYLDEVPFAFNIRSELPDINAFDLERVEVLRGSQGTLYGVNAMGGVVRVLTRDANPDTFEGSTRLRASQTANGGDNYSGDLAINIPLIPGQLAIRGVASYNDSAGYIDSTFDGHRDINDLKAQSYRFKANYNPSEYSSIEFGFSRSVIENGAPSQTVSGLTTPNSDQQFDERAYNTYNLMAEHRWTTLSLLSSTAYVDYQHANTFFEFFPPPPSNGFLQELSLRSFSQEIRLSSHLDGPWQWSAGGFYKDTTEALLQDAPAYFPVPFIIEPNSKSYAVFGEVTRALAEGKFEVTTGLRYFSDKQIKPNLSNFGNPLTPAQPAKYDRVTGRLVLTYKPQPDQMIYTSVATGFRSGLTRDAAVAAINPNFPGARPDSLITYEVGTKGAPGSGTFSYDVAVYYMDWKDIQQQLAIPVGSTAFSLIVNGGRAKGVGFDSGLSIKPTRDLTVRASVSWNDLKFVDDILSFDSASGQNVLLFPKNGRINSSPAWTGSLGTTYSVRTSWNSMSVVFSSNYSFSSIEKARTLSGVTLTETESDEFHDLSARVGLEWDHWSVGLYAENLLNELSALSAPNFELMADRQRPRTIGLQATFKY